MHWQMDDQFLGHHKTKRAMRQGLEALLMWFALRTYVAINLTDGFIPDEDIDDLPHAPKNPRKWLQVLVECGKPVSGGARGPGLVDRVPGGWKLHDYEHHGELKEQVEARRAANRERQRRLREQRESRKPAQAPSRVSNTVSNTVSNAVTGSVTNASPSHPIPSHDQDLPATTTQRPESSEPRLALGSAAAAAPDQRIPCPADLDLLAEQQAALELSPGIPRWAQVAMRDEFVAAELGDPAKTMPLAQWRKCLSKAMCSRWSDRSKWPKKPDERESGNGSRGFIQLEDHV